MKDYAALTNRALDWALLWSRMESRAMVHLSSLDPRTDRLAILRWYGRWLRSRSKMHEAFLRADYLALSLRD